MRAQDMAQKGFLGAIQRGEAPARLEEMLALNAVMSEVVVNETKAADQLAALEAAMSQEKKLMRLAEIAWEYKLQEVVDSHLFIECVLHTRTLLEEFERVYLSGGKRESKWGGLNDKVVECILKAVPAWKREYIPVKATQMHSRTSGVVHKDNVRASGNVLLLVEGPLTQEEMRFLRCLAEALGWPYKMVYKKQPAALTERQ